MKKIAKAILLATPLISSVAFAKTLTVGIDLSSSNPLISSEKFAQSAAILVADNIRTLKLGDTVLIRHIGDNRLDNLHGERIQISRRNRADKVAQTVAQYISGIPKKTYDQGATRLLAFLELQNFGCSDGGGQVILLTDGIENSAEAPDAEGLLLGKKALPAPKAGALSGCDVWFVGLGQSSSGSLPVGTVRHLQNAWGNYLKAAGANFTTIVNP